MMKQLALCAALVSATTTAAYAGNGTNLTNLVPDNTQLLLVVDVAASRKTPLIKDSVTKVLDGQPDVRAKLDEIGLDPLRDIDTVAMAFGGFDEIANMKDTASALIIVEGKFTKGALAKMKSQTKTTYAGVDIYAKDDTEAALIGNRLFFTKTGKMTAEIDLAKGKSKATLAASPAGKAMRDAVKRTDTKRHLWATVLLPSKDRDSVKKAGVPVEAVSFGFSFSSDLEGGIRIDSATEADAKTSFTMLQQALPQVKMMMGGIGLRAAADTVALKQDKASITASIKVTQAELKSLVDMVAQKKQSAPPPAAPTLPAKTAPASGTGLGGKKP